MATIITRDTRIRTMSAECATDVPMHHATWHGMRARTTSDSVQTRHAGIMNPATTTDTAVLPISPVVKSLAIAITTAMATTTDMVIRVLQETSASMGPTTSDGKLPWVRMSTSK